MNAMGYQRLCFLCSALIYTTSQATDRGTISDGVTQPMPIYNRTEAALLTRSKHGHPRTNGNALEASTNIDVQWRRTVFCHKDKNWCSQYWPAQCFVLVGRCARVTIFSVQSVHKMHTDDFVLIVWNRSKRFRVEVNIFRLPLRKLKFTISGMCFGNCYIRKGPSSKSLEKLLCCIKQMV